jgi:hypothetical protein
MVESTSTSPRDKLILARVTLAESPFIMRRGRHDYLFQQMDVFISDLPAHFAGER